MNNLKSRRAFIVGLSSTKITNKERLFLRKYKPWGVILFARNIKSVDQTKKLTNDIKKIFKDPKYPILIDEEGGMVTRIRSIIDNSHFPAKYFGDNYKKDKTKSLLYLRTYIKQISHLLRYMGISINTVPVLDIPRPFTSKVIGTRAISKDINVINKIGEKTIEHFKEARIATVIKHIPGHGLAKSDSHLKLPVVDKTYEYLMKNDFKTFKNKKSLFAMTAHILFRKIDANNPVTHSSKIIGIIRKKLKFNNLIISDDISMKALKFNITLNTIKAFTAGCDLVLHCNGKIKEMTKVAENSKKLNKFIIEKTLKYYRLVGND